MQTQAPNPRPNRTPLRTRNWLRTAGQSVGFDVTERRPSATIPRAIFAAVPLRPEGAAP